MSGAKAAIVGSSEENYDKFGRWTYSGNVLKQKGNKSGDIHSRWVVLRGWKLYWYREAGDSAQKGVLILGSRDIKVSDTVIPNDPTTAPEVCFSL